MAQRYDSYWRLEPDPQRRSFAAGFAARLHDPLWFLARQWQMGEHQGENASTPVLVKFKSVGTALNAPAEVPLLDPLTIPPEAIIEGEPDDWWTMGRRIRLGAIMASRVGLTTAAASYKLLNPPPPYEWLAGRFDGLALWHDRATLDADGSRFGDLGIPEPRHSYWQAEELVYQSEFPLAGETGYSLNLPRHRGTAVDWFSADALSEVGSPEFTASGASTPSQVYPTALQYPGAPRSRWWEIEDAAVDLGGYPPDTSHFPTTLLIDLVASHSDDWFLFPVDGRVGHVLTLVPGSIEVKDSFGDPYIVSPPADWTLFKTTGLDSASLVMWLRAVTPLQGEPLEKVLLGCDEYSNMLWAVELRVDSRDMTPPTRTPEQEEANPSLVKPRGPGKPDEQARYLYVPGQDATAYWHPYELVDAANEDGQIVRRFVQRRLADLGLENPELLPPATAQVLRVFGPSDERVHEINPSTIPTIGVTLERRAMLARDVRGNPLMWIRRQRMPFLAPPGRRMRFDLMADDTFA